MNQKESPELTDQPLPEQRKPTKPSPLLDAFFIGFLVGIVVYSVVGSSWGWLTLIPLVMIYRLLKKPRGVK